MRRLLKLLGRMGKVDEVAHDHFFLRETVAEMVDDRQRHWRSRREAGQFIAAQFRDRLDNGRKVAIQILEFFDRHGVTLRRGDLRRINKHRLDLFRRPRRQPNRRKHDSWKRIVPGGASGLQIREGPRAGPWWVRLPFSSATSPRARPMHANRCRSSARSRRGGQRRSSRERHYRREAAERIAALECERVFAFRRLNVMRPLPMAWLRPRMKKLRPPQA